MVRISVVIAAVWMLGCSKGTASFASLGQSLPQPMFSGATVLNLTNTSATVTNAVQGQCDSRIHSLQFSAVSPTNIDFSAPANFTTSGLTVDCTGSGQFSLTLNSLTSLGFTLADNTTYEIQVRGLSDGGLSNPSSIRILYSNGADTGPRRVLLTSGSTASSSTQSRLATSPNFRAQIRVDHMTNVYTTPSSPETMSVKHGNTFIMKVGVAAESD